MLVEDDAAYNIWDGLPDKSHLESVNNRDHLNRTMMDKSERQDWTYQLWCKQITKYITEGSRGIWEYKKCNKGFLRVKKKRLGLQEKFEKTMGYKGKGVDLRSGFNITKDMSSIHE